MKRLFPVLILLMGCTRFWGDNEVPIQEEPFEEHVVEPIVEPVGVAPPPPPLPLKRVQKSELAIGDCFDISLFGEEEMTTQNVAIAQDGFLYYTLAEGVSAAGRPLSELRQKLKRALEAFFIDPKIIVVPVETALETDEPTKMERPEIEVSTVLSDAEIAQKIFEQTRQSIQIQKGSYRLQKGDQLILAIYGEPATKQVATIEPDGSLYYLFLDPFQASGKTISELRHDLQNQLKSTFKYPVVMISLIQTSQERSSRVGSDFKSRRF